MDTKVYQSFRAGFKILSKVVKNNLVLDLVYFSLLVLIATENYHSHCIDQKKVKTNQIKLIQVLDKS